MTEKEFSEYLDVLQSDTHGGGYDARQWLEQHNERQAAELLKWKLLFAEAAAKLWEQTK